MLSLILSPIPTILAILIGGLLLLQIPSNTAFCFERVVALTTSLAALLVGVLGCFFFNLSAVGFQFLVTLPTFLQNNLTLSFGADGLSMVFLLLTLFVFPVCFLAA
jgi:NADH:ubiquinone oxidoreductase subunit 4 (subunit M)